MTLFGADSYRIRYVLKLWNSLPWDISESQKHKWTHKGIMPISRTEFHQRLNTETNVTICL